MFASILFFWIIGVLDYYYDQHYYMKTLQFIFCSHMLEAKISLMRDMGFFLLFYLLLIFFTQTNHIRVNAVLDC